MAEIKTCLHQVRLLSNARFVAVLKTAIGYPVVPFHCIQHQQALLAGQSEESGATDGNREKKLIISLFHGHSVLDSSTVHNASASNELRLLQTNNE
jgi:hypothetical protein